MVKNHINHGQPTQTDTVEKNEIIVIVRKYMDKNIRNSGDIRKLVNKDFPGVAVRNARTTVSGSILLEFEDKATAENVIERWKPEVFGGNSGIVKLKQEEASGIIKYVYTDRSEEQLTEEVKNKYPDTRIELFKKNQKFTGTIKVIFKSVEDRDNAVAEVVKLFEHRYIMENYHSKPRLIML